jgi:hypothetical protein
MSVPIVKISDPILNSPLWYGQIDDGSLHIRQYRSARLDNKARSVDG